MLTPEQQAAFTKIKHLFTTGKNQLAVLTGSAGTGKTFLTDALAKVLSPSLCAMTHKAAAVLSKQTGRKAQTLAKLLKHQAWHDYDNGQYVFKSTALLNIATNSIFIDESSMMTTIHYNEVLKRLLTAHNVLLIGDQYQLPSVNEPQFSALKQRYNIPRFELLTPQRYAQDSGINVTATAIRDAIIKSSPNITGMAKVLQNYSDVQWIAEREATDMMSTVFAQRSDDLDAARVISFTNDRVQHFNRLLKASADETPTSLAEGDLVMANEAYVVDKVVVLQNNATFRIEKMLNTSVELDGVRCYYVMLNNDIDVYVPHNVEALSHRLGQFHRQASMYLKRSKERKQIYCEFFKFKEQFADLRLNYAQTVHKAQGSTYSTCFFDLTKLNHATEIGRRLLYTGVTRAARRLVLFR